MAVLAVSVASRVHNIYICTYALLALYVAHSISCVRVARGVAQRESANASKEQTLEQWRRTLCENFGFRVFFVFRLAYLPMRTAPHGGSGES